MKLHTYLFRLDLWSTCRALIPTHLIWRKLMTHPNWDFFCPPLASGHMICHCIVSLLYTNILSSHPDEHIPQIPYIWFNFLLVGKRKASPYHENICIIHVISGTMSIPNKYYPYYILWKPVSIIADSVFYHATSWRMRNNLPSYNLSHSVEWGLERMLYGVYVWEITYDTRLY